MISFNFQTGLLYCRRIDDETCCRDDMQLCQSLTIVSGVYLLLR